jgi:hypothetical protein
VRRRKSSSRKKILEEVKIAEKKVKQKYKRKRILRSRRRK